MSGMRAVIALVLGLSAWSAEAPLAQAQTLDAGAIPSAVAPVFDGGDSDSDGDRDGNDANPAEASAAGGCLADPIPLGHEAHAEYTVSPARPVVGDRVIITYRLFHRSSDGIEFDPDPVVFSQPDAELEFAREQPERDRRAHAGPGGAVYGEVQVAVQGFKTADVVIAPQLARLRAAGDVVRICTPEVRFRVHDPFGNTSNPYPRDVTSPELVTEDAYRWRWIALALDLLFAVVVTTLAVSAYLRGRPRPIVPQPPPRPAWIIALEALDAIARSDLLSRGLTKEYYDAISDVVRRYLGGARGFDAIEMTTEQVLHRMRRTPLPGATPAELEALLRECDLVKFARYVPSHEESEAILETAYAIVRRSSPASARSPANDFAANAPPPRTVDDATSGRRA